MPVQVLGAAVPWPTADTISYGSASQTFTVYYEFQGGINPNYEKLTAARFFFVISCMLCKN